MTKQNTGNKRIQLSVFGYPMETQEAFYLPPKIESPPPPPFPFNKATNKSWTKKQLLEVLSDPCYPEDMEVFICNKLGNIRPIGYVCIGSKNNYPSEKALPESFIVINH